MNRQMILYLFFLSSLAMVSGTLNLRSAGCLALRGGDGLMPEKPSRPLSALKQKALLPDDLWPSEPQPGRLAREHHGYLKEEFVRHGGASGQLQQRIPSVLHRVIFLGTQPDISESQLYQVMDNSMLDAYRAWESENRHRGFRFELYNLAKAEAYIARYYDRNVLEAFQQLQPYAYKSDLFRYLLLYNEGGWYVDLKLGLPAEFKLSFDGLLDALAAELNMQPNSIGFVGTGQNMVWNVPGAEGVMNAFLGAKPQHPVLGDTIARIVDDITCCCKGQTPWSLTGALNSQPSTLNPQP
jgi:hypothetical protein